MSKWNDLKRLAEKATQAELEFAGSAPNIAPIYMYAQVGELAIVRKDGEKVSEDGVADAEFIINANPAAILEMIAESERMRQFLSEVSRTSGDKWAVMRSRELLKEFGA